MKSGSAPRPRAVPLAAVLAWGLAAGCGAAGAASLKPSDSAAAPSMAPARGAPSAAAAVPPQARLRVAFVDTARILRDSAVAKAASRKLAQTFEPRRLKLNQLSHRIDALRAKLADGAPSLSDDQRLAAQQQLSDLGREFRDEQQAFAEDLNAQRNADVSRILDQANAVVGRVARDKGCEIVFQGAVYVNPRIDITQDVIRAMDSAPPR